MPEKLEGGLEEKTEEGKEEGKVLLVVRVRGSVGVTRDVERAMKGLRLTRRHHATLVEKTPSTLGELQKTKDYLTWGEAGEAAVEKVLAARGRLSGGKPITQEWLAKTGRNSLAELASALAKGETTLGRLEALGLKPVFRMHPPRKGFGRIKEYYPRGALGYRGAAIDELIEKML